MGYLHELKKERNVVGIDFPQAYHSIDSISLSDSTLYVNVGVYATRDAKYQKHLLKTERIAPQALPQSTQTGEEASTQSVDDLAQYTAILYSPNASVVQPLLGLYMLEMDATKVFPSGVPFPLDKQKDGLYPDVKRLLGHSDGVDVIESGTSDDVPVGMPIE